MMRENTTRVGGLIVGYNALSKIGVVATRLLKLEIPARENLQATGIGIGYFYHDDGRKGRESIYIAGVESNDLIVTADNQKIFIGKAVRTAPCERFTRKRAFNLPNQTKGAYQNCRG